MDQFLFSKNEVYKTKYTLYQYNDDDIRIVKQNSQRQKGFEDINPKNNYISKEEIERISISRSRRNIRELLLSNNFEYFATLTINSNSCDRFSLTECQKNLRKQLKSLKRKNSNFAYLFITEKHKDGAYHFHGLVKGVTDFYKNNLGYLSHKTFDQLGYNSFSKIKDYNRCVTYVLKYITKDCVKNEARDCLYFFQRSKKSC